MLLFAFSLRWVSVVLSGDVELVGWSRLRVEVGFVYVGWFFWSVQLDFLLGLFGLFLFC